MLARFYFAPIKNRMQSHTWTACGSSMQSYCYLLCDQRNWPLRWNFRQRQLVMWIEESGEIMLNTQYLNTTPIHADGTNIV